MGNFLVAFELIALWVYGVYSQDRLWMPRPEFNYLSYSYWIEIGAMVFALTACKFSFRWTQSNEIDFLLGGLFAAEIEFLRELDEDYVDEKRLYNTFPYSTSNDSRLQLTSSRHRFSQSEM